MRSFVLLISALALLASSTACGPIEPQPDPKPAEQAPVQVNSSDNLARTAGDTPQTDASDTSITDRMADEHDGDSPKATDAAKQEPAGEVVTKEVDYFSRAGEPITGYLAHPEGETDGLPAVLVIHEWWGLNDNIRAMTRRLAGEGYLALAVDLYRGEAADTPEDARRVMSKVMQNKQEALVNLSAARRWIEDEHSPDKIGLIGWCFGGGWALRGALNMTDKVDAVVMYYGEVITDESQLADLQAPLLGIFGGEDEGIPPEDVREFEATLDELDKQADINLYQGADHAFANPSGQNYDKEAADKAWQKTAAFLEQHLGE